LEKELAKEDKGTTHSNEKGRVTQRRGEDTTGGKKRLVVGRGELLREKEGGKFREKMGTKGSIVGWYSNLERAGIKEGGGVPSKKGI